ncbi:hypothetical protein M8C21_004366 [Ambrosia artemisiifolia]|uniref:NLP1-9 GAF domain-containing protein n=1 Tax=Ambrosia artemisiifolia TaxID=4212 RepID=A0AAD5C4B1_AMBAR|nr:hypothetical protein M8C21_004366 [Ambrosia artemisiifolia]
MMMDDLTICMLGDPTRSYPGRQASWIHVYNNGQYDEHDALNLKIHSAFEAVKSFPFKRIIFQFWRPQTEGGRRVLESSRNAYAFAPCDRLLKNKYWGRCMKYKYSIDEGEDNPDWIISGGPVATAFLNRSLEVVLDLRAYRGSPLVDYGLECGLTCCVMVPVFYGGSFECLGVVECSMKHRGLLVPIVYELKRELERVGFSIYHLQGSWPYNKTISGDLDAAKSEIENALEIACESHALTLGQVWIPYESDASQMFLVKVSGYSVDSNENRLSFVKDFYDKFDVIYVKTGEGLAWKTLQTHQPHLCKNIYKLNDNRGILALLSSNAKSKCAFVICLRSTHTGDLDYAFEFFWPLGRNHFIMMETLLLTLRKCLPSFKCASGEQLGDELFVVDVENSSTSTPIKIFQRNKLSETRTWAGMNRKSTDSQSDLNQSNQYPLTNPEGEDDNDDDDLAILAAYRNQSLLFYLPSSSTFENVMEKLRNEFELDPTQTYKVEYEVAPGQWSSLVCLEGCRRIEDTDVTKLRVVPNCIEVGFRWITNS